MHSPEKEEEEKKVSCALAAVTVYVAGRIQQLQIIATPTGTGSVASSCSFNHTTDASEMRNFGFRLESDINQENANYIDSWTGAWTNAQDN